MNSQGLNWQRLLHRPKLQDTIRILRRHSFDCNVSYGFAFYGAHYTSGLCGRVLLGASSPSGHRPQGFFGPMLGESRPHTPPYGFR